MGSESHLNAISGANLCRIRSTPVIFAPTMVAENELVALRHKQTDGVVRIVRGWKCRTEQALHNEIGAALQFPGYYGENWDALDECICDLSWMPASWYLIAVINVAEVLPDDDHNFRTFLHILLDAARAWGNPDPKYEFPRRAIPFNLLFTGEESELSRTRRALAL